VSEVVKVEGLKTLQTTLGIAAHRITDFSEPARKTSTMLGARGRANAPRRTGRLSASVRGRADGSDAVTESALVYANRTHWGYARYHQRAQPWLVEGRDDTEATWMRNYEERVEVVLDDVRGA
jgi:hypothetical protein